MIMHVIKKENNRKLIQTLYQNGKSELYYVAFDVLKDAVAAENVVYNCFRKLLERPHLYSQMSYEHFKRLAYILTRYLAYSKSGAIINLPVASNTVALGNLSEEERCLLTLHYVFQLTPHEIGNLTGSASALIRSRIQACQNKLSAL